MFTRPEYTVIFITCSIFCWSLAFIIAVLLVLVHSDFYPLCTVISITCSALVFVLVPCNIWTYLLPFSIATYLCLVFVTTTIVLVFFRSPHQVNLLCIFPFLILILNVAFLIECFIHFCIHKSIHLFACFIHRHFMSFISHKKTPFSAVLTRNFQHPKTIMLPCS